ncbi:MAG: hypothetical protein NVS2B16_38080 [Chloroflexota bacterium]
MPDAELWIVGTRRPYSPEGENGVRWFGRVPGRRVAELYLESSTFVLPSLFDPSHTSYAKRWVAASPVSQPAPEEPPRFSGMDMTAY